MADGGDVFDRSIRRQIELNKARTPTERMQALYDLLDAARAMAPTDPESRARRLRVRAARQRDREQFRAYCRRLLAAGGPEPPPGV